MGSRKVRRGVEFSFFGKFFTFFTRMRIIPDFCYRDEMFRRSLGQLKQDIVKANALVQEANFLAEETGRMTKFSVTLQIPPANLGPNRKVKV